MVHRNNAGRLGSGFISVCLETRWLGRVGGFYVPERPCIRAAQLTEPNRAAEMPRATRSRPNQGAIAISRFSRPVEVVTAGRLFLLLVTTPALVASQFS